MKPCVILREKEVRERTKLAKTTRWRLEKAGKFPKRRQLSANAVGWLSTEIDKWMATRQAAEPVKARGKQGGHHG